MSLSMLFTIMLHLILEVSYFDCRKKHGEHTLSFKTQSVLKGSTKATKKSKEPKFITQERDQTHLMWWKEVSLITRS